MPKAAAKAENRASSRERILAAAVEEFSRRGLDGARVDSIAEAAQINKQMIYYYFGSKEQLYVSCLEAVFDDIRSAERRLDLSRLSALEAIRRFVEYTFDYVNEHREFVRMLMNENLQRAKYLKTSEAIATSRQPLFELLGELIDRGVASGEIKVRPDPATLYITISSLCFFYASNIHTMSVTLDTDLRSKEVRDAYRLHVVNVVLQVIENGTPPLRPAPPETAG